jgi:hypothetical protein
MDFDAPEVVKADRTSKSRDRDGPENVHEVRTFAISPNIFRE